MSFLDRTRQAAEKARQAAAERAHQAQLKIHEQAPIIQAQTREGLGIAGQNIKVGAKQARKSAASIVDRMDPGILADIVIKATALQERANASLRAKGSPYRIGEITITAALPPQLGFTIARIGDIEEELTGREIESAELATSIATEEFSLVPTDADGQPIEVGPAFVDATDTMDLSVGTVSGVDAAPEPGMGGSAWDGGMGMAAPVASSDGSAQSDEEQVVGSGFAPLAPGGQVEPASGDQLAGDGERDREETGDRTTS